MKINFVRRPLNHRLWKLVYLLAILLPLSFYGKANDTLKVNRPERIEAPETVSDYLPPETYHVSQRLVDPSGRARVVNSKKLKAEIAELNKAVDDYNALLRSVKYFDELDADKASTLSEKITNHWDRITYLYKHFDEVSE